MPDPDLRQLADEYWEALLEANPVYATFLGDHRYDDRLSDLSAPGEAAQRAMWAGFQDRAGAIDPGGLDQRDRVTLGLLCEELHNAITHLDLRLTEMAWDQMDGVHASLLTIAAQLNAPTPEAARMLLDRHRQLGAHLAQACERFREGVAAGRTPPRIVVERVLNQLDGYLASPIESDGFVSFAGPAGWDGEPAWRDELVEVARAVIRPAFQRYRDHVAEHLAPVARPDERSGLQWLDDDAEIYRVLIRSHTSLAGDPSDIHRFGLDEVNGKLPAEYARVGHALFGLADEAAVFERLRSDRSLYYRDGQEILGDAAQGLEAASAAMADWFGRLPVAGCDIKEVPEYLAPDAPAAYYFPPAPDGSRPGTYFVNTHEPSRKNRYETASVAYHEAIPGHHLQLAIASELDGLPDFQKQSMGHTAYVEGWGLYAERLADEMGLYATDLDRIGMLVADSWRSCRLVVDTGMHALGWSRRAAIDFMTAHTPISEEEVAVEVDRYLAMPGQALAYKVGQREILALRASARARLGDRFDIKGFHDTVLGSSAVTLPILAGLVDAWVDQTAAPSTNVRRFSGQ